MRSKSGGGARARQASPRTLAIAGGVALAVIIAVVLAVVLTGGKKTSTATGDFPTRGSSHWAGALQGAPYVAKLFKGIPQSGLVLGNPNAPATLTEYIDLQCPVCQEFESTMLPTLVQKYVRSGKLNIKMQPWSIRDFPGGPQDSTRGQKATIAASLQNKAFPFAELLYLNQGQENSGWLNDNMVLTAASSVDRMQVQQVPNDAGSSSVKSTVSSVDGTASAGGFNSTPTLLLNHKGQKPQVVARSLPNLSQLEAQIQSAIAG
ncbi:MAG: thioredoxin domain-containing protein [Gaiellaceae bacterium]